MLCSPSLFPTSRMGGTSPFFSCGFTLVENDASEPRGPICAVVTKHYLKSKSEPVCLQMPHFYFGEGNGNPLQYSCLENPMDEGAWWAAVRGVAKSWTRLSDFTFTFHFHALEKEMATHSSVLACRIPGMGEPGGLPSMGSHRVGHD